jgi:hypothetical protein
VHEQADDRALVVGHVAHELLLHGGDQPPFGRTQKDTGTDLVRRLGLDLADLLGDEEEVVVVHPDEVAGAPDLEDGLGERPVGGLVRGPVLVRGRVLGRDVLPEQVVEQRPKGWCDAMGSVPRHVITK